MSGIRIDTAIIGAGPYGLGLAQLLDSIGVERRVFGRPMQFWQTMPRNMFLKSFGFATSIPCTDREFTLPAYCRARDEEDCEPIPMQTFASYGLEYQQRYVADADPGQVTRVERASGGFRVTVDSGENYLARHVVVATGLTSYQWIPPLFDSLPASVISHTADHQEFDRFKGQDVTVIGAGQSALQAAALLHEAGATTRLLAREDVLWNTHAPTFGRPLLDRLRQPMSMLGAGRKNWLLEHFPGLFIHLPAERRVRFTRGYLGPKGAWWLRSRVEGPIDVHSRTAVKAATVHGSRVRLAVRGPAGDDEITTDHVVVGTGFEVDVDRLPFLAAPLRSRVARIEKAPALSPYFESSVPGLYFVGPAAAFCFGPLSRFVCGAPYALSRVSSHIRRARPRLTAARAFQPESSRELPALAD
jgi:cation diffusion facilitator CzcD-associated flavoprotein CzcO